MVWLVVVLCLTGLFLWISLKQGPQVGLAIVVPLSWLFPAWLIYSLVERQSTIVASGIDVKVAVGTLCLILYCVLPGRTFPVKLVASDFAMLGLFLTHIISDVYHDGFNWGILGRAYAEWYMPYVAGRVAFQSKDVVRMSWKVLAIIGVTLSVLSVIESFTEFNLHEMLFDQRPLEGVNRDKSRWGLHRAYGPTMNPIYFGVVQLLLLGWVVHAAVRATHRRASTAWIIAVFPVAFGILGTGSRGPLLGLVIAAYIAVFFFWPRSRYWLAGFAALCLMGGVLFTEPIIQSLEKWSGEGRRAKEFTIDGETRIHTSLRARLALFEVNKFALKHSGLLGFGTTSVSGFPVNVPLGPIEAEALKKVWTIENTYALVTLRFGYLGVGFLVAAGGLAIWQFYELSNDYHGDSLQWLCGSIGAATAAVLVVQATVWMPHEIGFPLIWTLGMSAGLTVADRMNQMD